MPIPDVWFSTNGLNWSSANGTMGWGVRVGHEALVYNNKMWVLGGWATSSGARKNDVWYSFNGVNWTNAANAASWSARSGHASVVYDNKMWVMGGSDSSGPKNDIWYSTNGANWSCATPNASWGPRNGHEAVVYDNKIWVLCSTNNGVNTPPDVWSSTGYNRILEADIAVSWRHPDNRTFGEDANLDGGWNNTTEDANGNGVYDSPARLRQLLVEDSQTGRLRRIYMGR